MRSNSLIVAIAAMRSSIRPRILVTSLTLLITGTILSIGSIQIASQRASQVSATPLTVATSAQVTQDPTAATRTADNGSTAAVSSTNGAPINTCVPYSGSLSPAPLDLSDTPTGLKQLIEPTARYEIFGTSAKTLRSQIQSCAPKQAGSSVAEYTAQTTYQMTWQYRYADDGSGRCRVTQASVGIRVQQILPLWRSTSAAQTGLASQWNGFITSLARHEDGHAALDIQYAQTLLDDLNNFPATPCGQMPQAVKQLIDSDVSLLAQANDNYDSTTNHGATQGAILPR